MHSGISLIIGSKLVPGPSYLISQFQHGCSQPTPVLVLRYPHTMISISLVPCYFYLIPMPVLTWLLSAWSHAVLPCSHIYSTKVPFSLVPCCFYAVHTYKFHYGSSPPVSVLILHYFQTSSCMAPLSLVPYCFYVVPTQLPPWSLSAWSPIVSTLFPHRFLYGFSQSGSLAFLPCSQTGSSMVSLSLVPCCFYIVPTQGPMWCPLLLLHISHIDSIMAPLSLVPYCFYVVSTKIPPWPFSV